MSARVRAVQERRRSNAAGPHQSQPTRADRLAVALADYEDDTPTETANPDPTSEETK
jgi:hypothetical protein